MLLQLLSYHYVSPCYLNFLSYFAHNTMTGERDLFFGGFRSLKSFSKPLLRVEELDRSGLHYQLAFELRTLFGVKQHQDEVNKEQAGDREEEYSASAPRAHESGPLSWFGRKDDTKEEEEAPLQADEVKVKPLPVTQTVVYHHFDIDNGKSLWILTSPEYTTAEEFYDVRRVLSAVDTGSNRPTKDRFKSSLEVLLWLVEWSLSEYGFHISALDESLGKLASPIPHLLRVGTR